MSLRTDLVDGQSLNPEVCQQFHGLIFGDGTLFQIGSQIGIDILVKTTVGQGVAIGLNLQNQLDEPGSLHSFVEGFCGLIGNLVADSGDLQQFLLSVAFCGLCLFTGKRSIAAGKVLDSINNDRFFTARYVLI